MRWPHFLTKTVYTTGWPEIDTTLLLYCQKQEKFVIILLVKIQTHLSGVATLPCENVK